VHSPRDESAGCKSRRNKRSVRVAWWLPIYQKRSFPRRIWWTKWHWVARVYEGTLTRPSRRPCGIDALPIKCTWYIPTQLPNAAPIWYYNIYHTTGRPRCKTTAASTSRPAVAAQLGFRANHRVRRPIHCGKSTARPTNETNRRHLFIII